MPAELVYWDSDCFLGWLQGEAGKVDLCEGTLTRGSSGEVVIITSALTIAEVLWMRGAPLIPETKATLVRRFFRRSYIRVRNVTRALSEGRKILFGIMASGQRMQFTSRLRLMRKLQF